MMRTARYRRWTCLLPLILCCLFPVQAAAADGTVWEETEQEEALLSESVPDETVPDAEETEDVELLGEENYLGFYIGPPDTQFCGGNQDYQHLFREDSESEDGSWSYKYDRNAEYKFTLTMHNGFNHSFAIFNNSSSLSQFRIIVEGSATISYWDVGIEEHADGNSYYAWQTVYVSGGTLTIEEFSMGLTCDLVAETGSNLILPNGISLQSSCLMSFGGTITVRQGSHESVALFGGGVSPGPRMSCYVDDRFPGGSITVEANQGQPAAHFSINEQTYHGDMQPSVAADLEKYTAVGVEVENARMEDGAGNLLYLGSMGLVDPQWGGLTVFDSHGNPASYIRLTNVLNGPKDPDKRKALEVWGTYRNAEGTETAEIVQVTRGELAELNMKPSYVPRDKVFQGWRVEGTGVTLSSGRKYMFPFQTNLEAVFAEDTREISVRFDGNGGDITGDTTTQDHKLVFPLPYPTRSGYQFIGWFTEREGGEEVTPDTLFYASDSSRTIYAHWVEQTGQEGEIHGTGVKWLVDDRLLRLTGTGALPSNLSSGPWTVQGQEGITAVSVGEGITFLPEALLQGISGMERIDVDPANAHYASVDGVLYNKEISRLIYYPKDAAGSSFMLPASVTEIVPGTLERRWHLARIEAAEGNPVFYSLDGVLFTREDDGDTLYVYPYARGEASYTVPAGTKTIGSRAFYQCRGLQEVVLPTGLTEIGDSAFERCWELSEVQFPSGLTTIGESAFDDCGLTRVEFQTGLTALGQSAFAHCDDLTEVTFRAGLTAIGDRAFSGCTALAGLQFPTSLTAIGDAAFSGCTALAGVQFPSGLTAIGDAAFSGCAALAGVQFPSGLTEIGGYAFGGCVKLTEADLPEGLQTIGAGSFSQCTALKRVRIPDSATLSDTAFSGCTALEGIVFNGKFDSYSTNTFMNCPGLKYAILGQNTGHVDVEELLEGNTALELLVLPYGVDTYHEVNLAESFPNLKEIYYPDTQREWERAAGQWTISESTAVHTDQWQAVFMAEDLGESTRVWAYDNYTGGSDYMQFLFAAYDTEGRMLSVGSGPDEGGLAAYDIPAPLSGCGRFAAYVTDTQQYDGTASYRPMLPAAVLTPGG